MIPARRWLGLSVAAIVGAIAPAAPSTAGPALLFDAADGRVFYAEDPDHAWHPASLTKILTAYVVFEQIKAGKLTLDRKIPVSEVAHAQPPSKVGLPVGGELTVELALQALIVKSANDVAVMLAEAIDGSVEAFGQRMTATAKRIGMTRSNFVNPHGLPAEAQVTTARDLARLARAVLRDYPQYAPLWAQADMMVGKIKLRSHNMLLKGYDGTDGLKTGFICDSGFNIVASASREGRRLVAVTLGEPSAKDRNLRAAGLLEHGFQVDGWTRALAPSVTIDTMPTAADAPTTPAKVRDLVVSWDCGRKRPVAKAKSKRTKAVAGSQSTGTTTTKAAPTPRATGSLPVQQATSAPKAANKQN